MKNQQINNKNYIFYWLLFLFWLWYTNFPFSSKFQSKENQEKLFHLQSRFFFLPLVFRFFSFFLKRNLYDTQPEINSIARERRNWRVLLKTTPTQRISIPNWENWTLSFQFSAVAPCACWLAVWLQLSAFVCNVIVVVIVYRLIRRVYCVPCDIAMYLYILHTILLVVCRLLILTAFCIIIVNIATTQMLYFHIHVSAEAAAALRASEQ